MADGEGLEGDHEGPITTTTSFSKLLFADDDIVSLDMGQSFYFSSTTSTEKPPKMLCFGSYKDEDDFLITTSFDGDSKKSSTPQKSKATKSRVTYTATDSSSASSGNNGSTTVATPSKSSRKRKGSGQEPEAIALRSSKVKTESPTSTGLTKVRRREKLGERVAALQHLVSPFGKTDTASVLHEAMGYIKFLQDQVQVLSCPYLQHQPVAKGGGNGEEESTKDLRSRGLCLVPVAYTVHVASSNGSDFWSSSVGYQ